MSALASKVCIMHFLRLLKFYVRLHHFLYKWILRTGRNLFFLFSPVEKSQVFFCCFFSGTPGFLHSSELKRPVRATRHPLLRSSSAQGGEEESDCVSRRSLIPPSVTVSRGSSLETPRSCLFRLRPLPLPSHLLPYPSPPLPPA